MTAVTIVAPSCAKAPGSLGPAPWHSRHPIPWAAWRLSRHCATMPGVFAWWHDTHDLLSALTEPDALTGTGSGEEAGSAAETAAASSAKVKTSAADRR